MIKEKNKNITSLDQSERDKWFDEMISNLKVDQLLMQTDTIDKDRGDIYNAMISNNANLVNGLARNASSIYFIERLLNSYVDELLSRDVSVNRFALELMNSKILVWAEISDDDDETEKSLILSAAKVNNEFYQFGFHISSTIVEESDNLEIPEQYKELV